MMKQFPIDKVYLFGSFAKNTQHDDSDIDVAIVVKQITDDFFRPSGFVDLMQKDR